LDKTISKNKTYMRSIKIILTAVAILAANLVKAQHYTPVDEGSEVKFKIKNFGVAVSGSFNGLKGHIQFDPAKLAAGSFDVTVQSNTVNTGIGLRDKHLKKEDYFGVDKFPQVQIKSTKISASNKEGWLFFYGTLTMKGVTKDISFPFEAKEQNGGYHFNGEFKINRRDYGVGGNSISLSDNLTVILNVFAKKM
jgi:polyisoprenoid-binding protein YceI